MLDCGIAFVLSEEIARKQCIRFSHPAVASYLRHVGSRRNGVTQTIAPDDRLKGQCTFTQRNIVQQEVVRLHRQIGYRQHHRLDGRLADAHLINLLRSHLPQAHCQGVSPDRLRGPFPSGS